MPSGWGALRGNSPAEGGAEDRLTPLAGGAGWRAGETSPSESLPFPIFLFHRHARFTNTLAVHPYYTLHIKHGAPLLSG
jgi:hypothetical protein